MALKSEVGAGLGDDNMNKHYQSLNNDYKKDTGGDFNCVKDNPHEKPPTGQKPTEGPMKTHLMNYTKMLEAMDDINDSIDQMQNDISNDTIEDDTQVSSGFDAESDTDLVDQLNKIFTPVLVMQGFETDSAGKIQEAMSEASVVMTEKTIIQFDDAARMAQLISVCALLIQRKKNTEKYQMWKKASTAASKLKLDMQKEEYEAAKALAQKYLVKVSTTNNSSVARNAAQDLLPQTQH